MKAEKGQRVILLDAVTFETAFGVVNVPHSSIVTVGREVTAGTGFFTQEQFKIEGEELYSPVFIKHGAYHIMGGDPLRVFIVKRPFDKVYYDMDISVAVLAENEAHALELAKQESTGFGDGDATVEEINMHCEGIFHREVKYG